MHRSINVTLPEETLQLLGRVAKKGDRGRLIAEAVRRDVEEMSRSQLKQRLQEGARRRADRDLHLATEWFPLEDEVWPNDHA